MSDSKFGQFGGHGKKKAKTGDLEDGPSSFRSSPLPFAQRHGMENIPDGGIQDSGLSAWKQEEADGEELDLDPLMVFGSGIMTMILCKLDARSVAQARLVSRDWLAVASSDKIWAPKDLFHMFRNGILNGDPIQIYLLLFCMEDYDSPFWGTMSPTMMDRPPEILFFTFTYVYYQITGRNKEGESVSPLRLLMSRSSSVNQEETIVSDGLSESLKNRMCWCTSKCDH